MRSLNYVIFMQILRWHLEKVGNKKDIKILYVSLYNICGLTAYTMAYIFYRNRIRPFNFHNINVENMLSVTIMFYIKYIKFASWLFYLLICFIN